MLSFFPNPYPDELLYSVLARYHIRCGNTSPKITQRELFGSTNAAAVVDLSCNLNSLIKRLSDFSNYTALDFIYFNTLYPIYAPFIPESRANLIVKAMKSKNGGTINTRLGVMASTVKKSKFLRFCPVCLKYDLENYGEAYWHRIHQVSGVILCPNHNTFILNSSVYWHGLNKNEYIAANNENCKMYSYESDCSELERDKLLFLAKNIEWILNAKLKNNSMEWLYEKYINILISKNYSTPNGSVHREAFIQDFCDYYGNNILSLIEANIDVNSSHNWLLNMVRKPREVFHPIKHLLLINFLGVSVEAFFNEEYKYKPFGIGPWPCLNKAALHYHQRVIKDVFLSYDNKTKQPVGTFTCSCGFVYSRRGPDKGDDDLYKVGRIKKFGTIWHRKLQELNQNGNLSFREMARQLNADTNTVIKYIKLACNNKDRAIKKHNTEKKFEIKRDRYRKQWLIIQEKSPDKIKTQIRNVDNASFEWLNKNDKQWINDNSQNSNVRVYANNRIDWKKRDLEILKIAKKTVRDIINSYGKPKRITISGIGKRLKIQALLEQHIEKLPEMQIYLNSVVEDIEAFQIRRVKWVAREMMNNNEQLKAWSIKRKAGIRTNCSLKVEKVIEDEINDYIRYRKVE
jgi:hypothetical protein